MHYNSTCADTGILADHYWTKDASACANLGVILNDGNFVQTGSATDRYILRDFDVVTDASPRMNHRSKTTIGEQNILAHHYTGWQDYRKQDSVQTVE